MGEGCAENDVAAMGREILLRRAAGQSERMAH